MPRKPPTKPPEEETLIRANVDGDPVEEVVSIKTSARRATGRSHPAAYRALYKEA